MVLSQQQLLEFIFVEKYGPEPQTKKVTIDDKCKWRTLHSRTMICKSVSLLWLGKQEMTIDQSWILPLAYTFHLLHKHDKEVTLPFWSYGQARKCKKKWMRDMGGEHLPHIILSIPTTLLVWICLALRKEEDVMRILRKW